MLTMLSIYVQLAKNFIGVHEMKKALFGLIVLCSISTIANVEKYSDLFPKENEINVFNVKILFGHNKGHLRDRWYEDYSISAYMDRQEYQNWFKTKKKPKLRILIAKKTQKKFKSTLQVFSTYIKQSNLTLFVFEPVPQITTIQHNPPLSTNTEVEQFIADDISQSLSMSLDFNGERIEIDTKDLEEEKETGKLSVFSIKIANPLLPYAEGYGFR